MRRSRFVLVCVAVAVTWACSNPKSIRVTNKNKDTLLVEIKNSKGLTVEEVQLLQGYLMRYGLAEGLKGLSNGKNDLPLEGKTVGELIELQKQWLKERETAEAQQKKLAEEAKAKEEAIAAELRKSVNLTVYEKGFQAADWHDGQYEDLLTVSIAYQNTSPKDIRAFQGTVVFQDLFGDKVKEIHLKITDPAKAGEKAVWKGSAHYNQFQSEDTRFKNAELKDLKIMWVPEKIIFADGTTVPKDEPTSQ